MNIQKIKGNSYKTYEDYVTANGKEFTLIRTLADATGLIIDDEPFTPPESNDVEVQFLDWEDYCEFEDIIFCFPDDWTEEDKQAIYFEWNNNEGKYWGINDCYLAITGPWQVVS